MTNRLIIAPTINLANLVYKAIRERKLPYNYCTGWVDCNGGIGLSLGHADWVGDSVYINPHTRR